MRRRVLGAVVAEPGGCRNISHVIVVRLSDLSSDERQILAFFSRTTGRPEVAADLTAEVFAAALAGAPSFRPELGSAQGWLFGIARHQLADAWEHGRVEDRARRRLRTEPLALRDEMLERIDELGDTEEALRLLAELPEDQRLAVHGRVVEERDYAELARSLQCSDQRASCVNAPAAACESCAER